MACPISFSHWSKFPKNSQDRHLGLREVKKQNFPRIPKIVIRVTKGQKAKYPKYSQGLTLQYSLEAMLNTWQGPK
ncbi:hypothetical protein HOLleu_27697 [Holothuria leucospilota]|uniref:Uncharacterized protein n=1 Tax=Holothuria leucospilota TaxID=206669 RepID=A0A9Q1BR54_HOLLE|nr:hypothetical protein HOLleu_27697 [Holothuria leucospilota]